MGNQSSKDQRLKQQHDVESLLSTWSLDDQNRLKNQYMLFSHSKEQTAKEVSGTVEVEQLSTAMTEWAPPSIQSSLASSFGYYVGQGAASISFASFLTAAQNLLRGPEQVQAAYAVYQEASRRYNCSLEQFIQWIARSGVPVWFESSGIAPPNADIWYKDEAHCQAAKRLADRLLYKAKKLKERARKREQEEMMLWLDETSTANKDERQNPLELWKIAVKQTFAVDKATFTEWIMETPDALLLLQCVAKFLFLGTTVSSDLHSLRTSGHSSPAIHAPTGESNLFDKHRFSRLLTPYDYFMLTRNLPLDALSWSSHERVRRRVSEDLAHDLIFTSRRDGMSWQVFVNRIVQQGATLLVVKAKDGSIFGGYADEPWMPVTDWYGNSSNFLFRLGTGKAYADEFLAMDAWSASQGTNDHFQYLCWGKKSLPNGKLLRPHF